MGGPAVRHTDPAITSEIYGHLDLEDMRTGINRLACSSPPQQLAPVVPLRKAPSAEMSFLIRFFENPIGIDGNSQDV